MLEILLPMPSFCHSSCGGWVFTGVCLRLFFWTVFQKMMQLGSPNLTYKCSMMSLGNPFILWSKRQGHESQKHWQLGFCWLLIVYILSKPAKQVWYWALRVYWEPHWPDSVCMYVCMYVCMWSNSSQTTEPICIKIIPANKAFYADCYRLLRFEIFTKYDEYFVIERTPFLNKRSFATAPQRR